MSVAVLAAVYGHHAPDWQKDAANVRPDGDAHLTEHMPAIYEQAELTDMEQVALRHIRANGDDRNLRSKRWKEVKSSLWRKGYLKRRIGDWAWIPRF
jgi:hypothetical protein